MNISSNADGILIIEDVFTEDECERIILEFEKSPTRYVIQESKVRMGISDKLWEYHWQDTLLELIQPRMESAISFWMDTLHHSCRQECWTNFGWYISKYDIGDSCRPHFDGLLSNTDGGVDYVALAGVSLSLRTLEDDGSLVFPNQQRSIECRRGTAIFFPTTYTHPHEVAAVSSLRYVLLGWLYYGRSTGLPETLAPGRVFIKYPYLCFNS